MLFRSVPPLFTILKTASLEFFAGYLPKSTDDEPSTAIFGFPPARMAIDRMDNMITVNKDLCDEMVMFSQPLALAVKVSPSLPTCADAPLA